jgi:hypothetical protein
MTDEQEIERKVMGLEIPGVVGCLVSRMSLPGKVIVMVTMKGEAFARAYDPAMLQDIDLLVHTFHLDFTFR